MLYRHNRWVLGVRLKPWDCAAGVLMVEEAGGTVTTMTGDPYTVFHRYVVTAQL